MSSGDVPPTKKGDQDGADVWLRIIVAIATLGDLMATVAAHDLEGIVAKRKGDPYRHGVRWWKIKNPAYTQAEGRGELLNSPHAWRRQ
jgi:hypothetical protein